MNRRGWNYVAQACIGLAFSFADPLAAAITIAMPTLVMCQAGRQAAYFSSLCYYAGALWPLMPAARNFFGPKVSMLSALGLWASACVLLSVPWLLVWSSKRYQAWWRTPLGIILGVIPPIGIIGCASPMMAAGFLFPGTSWWGLVACLLAPGIIATWPAQGLVGLGICTFLAYATGAPVPPPPSGWVAVDTHFGAIAHGTPSVTDEFRVVQLIQAATLSLDAKVILFPETVMPTWTSATDAFWAPFIAQLERVDKTVVIGTRIPTVPLIARTVEYAAAAAILNGGHPGVSRTSEQRHSWAYENSVVVRGIGRDEFHQRIPVPISMWNPFQSGGARLHVISTGLLQIRNQRAAVLICYEQLLVWPVIAALLAEPTVFLAPANLHWARGTLIPQHQQLAMSAWSHLFRVPYLVAVND
jgi:hypothetical protein